MGFRGRNQRVERWRFRSWEGEGMAVLELDADGVVAVRESGFGGEGFGWGRARGWGIVLVGFLGSFLSFAIFERWEAGIFEGERKLRRGVLYV